MTPALACPLPDAKWRSSRVRPPASLSRPRMSLTRPWEKRSGFWNPDATPPQTGLMDPFCDRHGHAAVPAYLAYVVGVPCSTTSSYYNSDGAYLRGPPPNVKPYVTGETSSLFSFLLSSLFLHPFPSSSPASVQLCFLSCLYPSFSHSVAILSLILVSFRLFSCGWLNHPFFEVPSLSAHLLRVRSY